MKTAESFVRLRLYAGRKRKKNCMRSFKFNEIQCKLSSCSLFIFFCCGCKSYLNESVTRVPLLSLAVTYVHELSNFCRWAVEDESLFLK